MRCFDFTYADNGQNIRGRRGYIYTTKKFQDAIHIASPIPFSEVDMYGRLECRLKNTILPLDIYTLLAMQIYLFNSNFVTDADACQRLIEVLADDPGNWSYTEIENLSDKIRFDGIQYDSSNITDCSDAPFKIHIPTIGNQKEKECYCNYMVCKHIPLLITRKKLPNADGRDLIDVAADWGFVTGSDPNQGFSPTTNVYYRFIHPKFVPKRNS